MVADYNVQLLLGVMECTNRGECRGVFPPDIAFPCSSCALGLNLAFGSSFHFSICSDAHNATD